MSPKFGTSGLRGLVTELTPELVSAYTRAFLAACPTGGAVQVGWDLRPSSPDIAEAVIEAIEAAGQQAVVAGVLPTPALALASMAAGQAAVMITGSHIPADRNGLKFYTPRGEISKQDEAGILAALDQAATGTPAKGARKPAEGEAARAYVDRYVSAFGATALEGLRIGVYQHSSVARDIMSDVVRALGGTVVELARSDTFIPVDTEAVDPETRSQLSGWCQAHALDALISTDGDADRPMVTDHTGQIVPGDVLGALTARSLRAEQICTPVSSNSMIGDMPEFTALHRTRIGSPYVIAAMESVLAETPTARVVGYEANGGFLLGFTAQGPAGPLSPLMTRDCLLPILAPLAATRTAGLRLADLVAALPPRFTAADRIAGIATEVSGPFIADLSKDATARAAFFADQGDEADIDLTDGLRVRFADGAIVHLRPSGNAPELRCYAEADSAGQAAALVTAYLTRLKTQLG